MTMPDDHPAVEDCLFHYTSAGGMKGILESRCIWATDSAFLSIRPKSASQGLKSKNCCKISLGNSSCISQQEAHPKGNAWP